MRCELCEAARITPWHYEDDECWIADCEFCDVPMVVWKRHDAHPPDAVKAMLHAKLAEHVPFEHFIDDHMRNIPDHYHAHARRKPTWIAASKS
jgi:hypothetical protein